MGLIGPRFSEELDAAGVAQFPFSWTEDGVQFGEAMTQPQKDQVNVVLAAHNPALPATPTVVEAARTSLGTRGTGTPTRAEFNTLLDCLSIEEL